MRDTGESFYYNITCLGPSPPESGGQDGQDAVGRGGAEATGRHLGSQRAPLERKAEGARVVEHIFQLV